MYAKARQGGNWLLSRVGEEEIFIPENMNDEQRQMGDTVWDFIEKEVWPKNEAIEHKEPGVSDSLLHKAGEIGLLMAEIPEAYGGLGLGKVTSTIMSEQATKQGSWTVSYMCHTGIGTLPILYFGTPEQK